MVAVSRPRNERSRRGPRSPVGSRVAGQLSGGVRGGKVWVNAFHGAGVTVDVDADDAEDFGLALIALARQARAGSG